jgi:4-hydroxy-tetrahydrodipicolinate synthase
MTKDGKVDLQATKHGIDRMVKNGVTGVIVLPMLGENASMTPAEHESVIRAAIEVVAGRVPMLSGLASSTMEGAKATAKLYQSFGVDGLMVFPSLGYKTDARETAEWYKGVAGASSLPIMVYNNPIAYGVDCTIEVLRELVDVPTIISIKEETGDIRRITDMYVAFGDRFSIFCGVDDLLIESCAAGAVGWVSGMANVWPAECTELFNLGFESKFEEARALYQIMIPSLHFDMWIKLVQCIKLAENLVYGAPEWMRAPRLPLIGDQRELVISTIQKTMADLAKRSK